jgi:hypothetical protein
MRRAIAATPFKQSCNTGVSLPYFRFLHKDRELHPLNTFVPESQRVSAGIAELFS